jgi:hypothetical protein
VSKASVLLLVGMYRGGGGCRHTFFEEKADLVARIEEIAVTDMIGLLSSAEFSHGMVVQREIVEHGVSFFEQRLCGIGTQGIGDEEVAIRVPEVELFGSEAVAEVGRRWWRYACGHCVWLCGERGK